MEYWEDIKSSYMSILEEVEHRGRWDKEMLKGIIVLIPKNNQSTTEEDWRPITLLNVSYKI